MQLAAGSWLWARTEMAESVDLLFVDEAGQMCLANVLAVSQAAKSIVLLGDPQSHCKQKVKEGPDMSASLTPPTIAVSNERLSPTTSMRVILYLRPAGTKP